MPSNSHSVVAVSGHRPFPRTATNSPDGPGGKQLLLATHHLKYTLFHYSLLRGFYPLRPQGVYMPVLTLSVIFLRVSSVAFFRSPSLLRYVRVHPLSLIPASPLRHLPLFALSCLSLTPRDACRVIFPWVLLLQHAQSLFGGGAGQRPATLG